MKDIIVVYPVKKTAMLLRNVLESNGYHVSHICALGATALGISAQMNCGVIVCASVLSDMSSVELAEKLPFGFDVVSLSKNGEESYMSNLVSFNLSLNFDEFLDTVSVLVSSTAGFTERSDNESEIVSKAKHILMQTKGFTEAQAHKFLQNQSMITGKKIITVSSEIIEEII